MGRIRKTANIAAILKRTNYRLLHSTCAPDVRHGFCSMLESILMDSGLYAGFGYITNEHFIKAGLRAETASFSFLKPGVLYLAHNLDDFPRWDDGIEITAGEYFNELTAAKAAGREPGVSQSFPDESRRHYYPHSAICYDYRKLSDDGES